MRGSLAALICGLQSNIDVGSDNVFGVHFVRKETRPSQKYKQEVLACKVLTLGGVVNADSLSVREAAEAITMGSKRVRQCREGLSDVRCLRTVG